MTAGGSRTVPDTTADINPDGLQLDKLLAAQVARMWDIGTDYYLYLYVPPQVPLPGGVVLLSAGLARLLMWRRRH
jgi:hypothetical protein